MNRYYIIFLFLISACSFDTRSGIWTEKNILTKNENITNLFDEKQIKHKEFNSNLEIVLPELQKVSYEKKNLTNNNGINHNINKINTISKFKFSKIKDFEYFEPELIIDESGFTFFDDKGNIIKFDKNTEISWKSNVYNKAEKKLKPKITLFHDKKQLIAFDNISKFYSLNFNTGEILWIKNVKNPINSQVKIHKNKIFMVDLNNILICFSLESGDELWRFGSGNNILKSNKRNSIVVKDNVVYFNNSLGDISAVNIDDGTLVWQIPTQSSRILENAFSLVNSDLVIGENELIFSNNRNQFFSLDLENGQKKWTQNISSVVRPVIIKNFIFTVSDDGYFFVIERNSGNIVRITKVLDQNKNIIKNIPFVTKRRSIENTPVGILIGKEISFLTSNDGRLYTINTITGQIKSATKIDGSKISRPFVYKDSLYVVKENSIIKLN